MKEQEVKIVMDEYGKLYVITEDGKKYALVSFLTGVFAR